MREVVAMINEFSNEITTGKLYISYPMVEAFKLYQKNTFDKVAFYQFKLDEKRRRNLVKLLRLFVPITKIILILDNPFLNRILNG